MQWSTLLLEAALQRLLAIAVYSYTRSNVVSGLCVCVFVGHVRCRDCRQMSLRLASHVIIAMDCCNDDYVSPAKTAEPIEMPFGGQEADLSGPREPCVRWSPDLPK